MTKNKNKKDQSGGNHKNVLSNHHHVKDTGVILSLLAMVVAFFLLSGVALNKQGQLAQTTISQNQYLSTSIDQNREKLPDLNAESTGNTGTATSSDTVEPQTNQPAESTTTPAPTTQQSATPGSTETIQRASTNPQTATVKPVKPTTGPKSGLSENLIIGFAISLGVFGAVTFLVFKKGN